MSSVKTKKELVNQFLDETPIEFEYFVQHAMDFSIQLNSLIKKNSKSQKNFADLICKEESEISKWLSGNHNFTLRSISKIEAALNQQLIFTREEIIERFLPFLFRNWKSTFIDKEKIDSLITFYTLSEQDDAIPVGLPSNTNCVITLSASTSKNNINECEKDNYEDTFSNKYIASTCITIKAA